MAKKAFRIMFVIMIFSLSIFLQSESGSLSTQTKQKSLEHEVTVTLKLVQIFVTDKKGNPVMNLKQEDFELFEDGKPKKIDAFEKHVLPQFREIPAIKPKRLDTTEEIPKLLLTRKFFLLLDYDRNDGQGIVEAKRSALRFLDTKVRPDDEVGIMTYAITTGLVVCTYLTKDHDKVRRIIACIKQLPLAIDWEFMGTGPPAMASDLTMGYPFLEFRDMEIEAQKDEGKVFASLLKELAKSMRYIPGSKNIILFSKGQPRFIYRDRIVTDKFHDSARELSTANTHIFSVNTGIREFVEKRNFEWGDHFLRDLSKISGGTYFEDVRKYDKVAEGIEKLTSNYYVLGYYIPKAYDGKFHEIKVKVKRKGLEVKAQRGYYNPRRFTELSDMEKRLELIQLTLSENPYFQNPIHLPMQALPCFHFQNHVLVTLVHIPLEKFQKVFKTKVEFVTAVFDRANNVVDARQGNFDIDTLDGNDIFAYTINSLSPGEYDCRFVFRDMDTGKAAIASVQTQMPPKGEEGILLSSPLYMIPWKPSDFLNFTPSKRASQDNNLTLNTIYPYLSNKHTPLVNELDKDLSSLFVVIRCDFVEGQEPEIDISFDIKDESLGKTITCDNSVLESERIADSSIVLCEIFLPELKPGSYSLIINVSDLKGKIYQSTQKIRVK